MKISFCTIHTMLCCKLQVFAAAAKLSIFMKPNFIVAVQIEKDLVELKVKKYDAISANNYISYPQARNCSRFWLLFSPLHKLWYEHR